MSPLCPTAFSTSGSDDLQGVIDDLRAETAQLRAELQQYRSRTT